MKGICLILKNAKKHESTKEKNHCPVVLMGCLKGKPTVVLRRKPESKFPSFEFT